MNENNINYFLDEFGWEVLQVYIKYGFGDMKLYHTSFFALLNDDIVLLTLNEYADRAVDCEGKLWKEKHD